MPDDNVISPTPPTQTPETPSVPQPPLPPTFEPMPPAEPQRGGRRKWLIIGLAVLLVVLLGAGYVFGFYLPNRPDNVYRSGLTNSGKALDKLVSYSNKQQAADYKRSDFTGNVKVKSGDGSYDIGLKGSADQKGDLTMDIDANIMGEKASGNLRSIVAEGNTTPDIYFRVNNAKGLLASYGLDALDGKWISVDHTLIDTYAKEFGQDSSASSKVSAPTYEQLNDAATKVQAVNKQYIFTTDPAKAVLSGEKFIGKETLNNRTHYHYTTGYSKAHLQAYVGAVKQALDSSKLNEWSKASNDKDLSKVLSFETLEKTVKDAKGGYRFDLWVDKDTKLMSKLQFADPQDKASKFTISQNYTGGDVYPFSLSFNSKDENNMTSTGTLNVTVDTKTNKVTANVSGNTKDAKGNTDELTAELSVTPSNQALTVTAPEGATSVNELLGMLLTGALGDEASKTTTDPAQLLQSQMLTYQ